MSSTTHVCLCQQCQRLKGHANKTNLFDCFKKHSQAQQPEAEGRQEQMGKKKKQSRKLQTNQTIRLDSKLK